MDQMEERMEDNADREEGRNGKGDDEKKSSRTMKRQRIERKGGNEFR